MTYDEKPSQLVLPTSPCQGTSSRPTADHANPVGHCSTLSKERPVVVSAAPPALKRREPVDSQQPTRSDLPIIGHLLPSFESQYRNPVQYSNPVLKPSTQTQYSNPVLKPSTQTEYSNPVLKPSTQTQYSNPETQTLVLKPRTQTLGLEPSAQPRSQTLGLKP